MAGDLLVQGTPQVLVLHRLFRGRAPAVALPARQPGGHALHHIGGVHVQAHLAAGVQRLESLDDGGQFHPVVGGVLLAAEQLFLMAARTHPHSPAAWARVALAGAVGPHLDHRHRIGRGNVALVAGTLGGGTRYWGALGIARRCHWAAVGTTHRAAPGTAHRTAGLGTAHRTAGLGTAHRCCLPQALASVAVSAEVKKRSPSVLGPKPGSVACSGCGMRPTTLPRALVMPAMSRREPFGLPT